MQKACFAGEKLAFCWNEMSTEASSRSSIRQFKAGAEYSFKPRDYEAVIANLPYRTPSVKDKMSIFLAFLRVFPEFLTGSIKFPKNPPNLS